MVASEALAHTNYPCPCGDVRKQELGDLAKGSASCCPKNGAKDKALSEMGSALCLLTGSAGGSGCRRRSGNNLIIRQEVLTKQLPWGLLGAQERSWGGLAPCQPTHEPLLPISAHLTTLNPYPCWVLRIPVGVRTCLTTYIFLTPDVCPSAA